MDTEYPPEAWKRLGGDLSRRREALGYAYRQRKKFWNERGDPSKSSLKTVERIERAERPGFPDETLAYMERLYDLEPGSVKAALRGGSLVPLPGTPGSGPRLSAAPAAPPFPVEDNGDSVIAWLVNRWPVRDDAHLAMRVIWSTRDASLEARRQALLDVLPPPTAEVRENGDPVIAGLIAAWPEDDRSMQSRLRVIWQMATGGNVEARRDMLHAVLYQGDPRAGNAPGARDGIGDGEDRQTS